MPAEHATMLQEKAGHHDILIEQCVNETNINNIVNQQKGPYR